MPRTTGATLDFFLQTPATVAAATVADEDVDVDVDVELFSLQSEADYLRLQLAKMQAKITQLEAAYEPLQLKKPRTAAAAATWTAAGLGPTAELETAILAIENWVFTQPNYESLTEDGWLGYLYTILEMPIRKAATAVALQN
jgi:hypothetical protein